MAYEGFYRNIYKENNKYHIIKNSERYLICKTLEDALYERDRFEKVNWDWDLFVQLADTPNAYIHIDLPPFERNFTHITHVKEYWTVLSKGANPRYYGCYHTLEEAERVRRIYNGRISHRNEVWRVRKSINGKMKHFGNFRTREEAEKRVEELNESNWEQS